MTAKWDTAVGCAYVLTEDDVCDGRNKLGLPVTAPLNVTLCGFCDKPVDAEGKCFSCMTIHIDGSLTETIGDPLLKRRAA